MHANAAWGVNVQKANTNAASSQATQASLMTLVSSNWLNFFLLLIAAGSYAVVLSTMSHQFVGAHPDELGKARQVVSDFRNWNHPQLLLFNLELGKSLLGLTTVHEVVRLGRYISNVYAAATVLIIALVGKRLFGTAAAWVFFAVFAVCSAVLVTGRYLKEDIFLLFGLAILIYALTLPIGERRWSTASGLIGGLGCAVVLSAKYIGFVFVVVFLFVYLYRARWEWRRYLTFLIPSFLATALIVNYRLVIGIGDFATGFEKEFSHATTAHLGIVSSPLSDLYLNMILEVWPLTTLVALGLFLIGLCVAGCRRPVAVLLVFIVGSIIAYGLLIQLAPTKIPRYCFPILMLLQAAFLVAAGELWRTKYIGVRLAVLIPGLLLVFQGALTGITLVKAIKNDTRIQLLRYVTSAPTLANALILTDAHTRLWRQLRWEEHPKPCYMLPRALTYTRLTRTEKKIPNPNGVRLRWSPFAADPCFYGECEDVDYIIVTCTAFTRFFRKNIHLDTANASRKAIYEDWLSHAPVEKQFGSLNNDLESRFGLYESPCIYILRNKKSPG
jgi:hypothetical protein